MPDVASENSSETGIYMQSLNTFEENYNKILDPNPNITTDILTIKTEIQKFNTKMKELSQNVTTENDKFNVVKDRVKIRGMHIYTESGINYRNKGEFINESGINSESIYNAIDSMSIEAYNAYWDKYIKNIKFS